MLTCRSLPRIDRVLELTRRVKSSLGSSIIMISESSSMDGSKNQKMPNLVWRPVSTQTTSVAECSLTNVPIETVSKLGDQEDLCSMSSDVNLSKEITQLVEGVNENISNVASEKYSISLEVGASVIKFIRGKQGSTQKQIEEEMGVKILLPFSRKEDCITIEGVSSDCVTKASERIETIINEAVRSPSLDYSHFISLPLAIHPELIDKLMNFQNSILRNNDTTSDGLDESEKGKRVNKSSTLLDMGIEKSIFIRPKTFHLTVLMLKLWNNDRLAAARDVLKGISPSVMDALGNRPISVRLKGLDCMKGSLAKARVLYAPVEEVNNEGRLLRVCQVIIDAFVKAGLVLERDANRSLKLHATVMNVRHRKRKDRRQKAEAFDAREIHERYGNEEWGEYMLREAHLSNICVFDENGYYHCCASIPFPTEPEA